MREIIMKTISAGPNGVHQPGSWRILPRAEADALVRGGFAVYATIEPEKVAIVTPAEIETVKPIETAVLIPKNKLRGRPKK